VTMVASQNRKKAKKSMSGMRVLNATVAGASPTKRLSAKSPRLFGRFATKLGIEVHNIFGIFMIGTGAAKEEAADADHGGAFENGFFKVVAHAHAEVAQVIGADFVPFELFENLPGAGKAATRRLLPAFQRGHGHQSDKLQIRH